MIRIHKKKNSDYTIKKPNETANTHIENAELQKFKIQNKKIKK